MSSESALCANCGYTVANDMELPTTPVLDLLGGNYVASESQAQMICDTISSVRAGFSRLESEITRLSAVLDGLTAKHDAFQIYTHSLVALVAPIRRLPPEVLSEIFLHYNDENNISDLRLNMAPLLLGGVCSRWRTVALSTPRLWTSFSLTIRPKYLKSNVMLAETWLARAGTCPLTIRLPSHGSFKNSMKPLMKVFLLHCEQWYDIDLSVPLPVLCSLAPAKNRLPSLQRLHLHSESEKILDIFEFAPRLRWLCLPFLNPSMVKIPWNQIEYLDMGTREVDRCLDLLHTTPNLEKCLVRITSSEPCQSHSSVQLLRLRSMTIGRNSTYLLDSLLLPKLHEISIDSIFFFFFQSNLLCYRNTILRYTLTTVRGKVGEV
jgi:F-box-like